MKGIIFVLFSEMVEKQFGLDALDNLLEASRPASNGAYTAGATYAGTEFMALVQELSRQTAIPVIDLVREFGRFMFPRLARKYPIFSQDQHSLKEFLKTIHSVIHVEVKKLYTDSHLPNIRYEDVAENLLTLLYQSPRKLCYLAEGLIEGAAKHFQTNVQITQPICMLNGADHCRLELIIG